MSRDIKKITTPLKDGLHKLGRSVKRLFVPSKDEIKEKVEELKSIQACKDASLTGNDNLRLLAVLRLGDFGSEAKESLKISVYDEHDVVRAASIAMLAHTGTSDILPLIERHSDDESDLVRAAVEYSQRLVAEKLSHDDGKIILVARDTESKERFVPPEVTPLLTSDDVLVVGEYTAKEDTVEYSISVENKTGQNMTDVSITLLSYPEDSLDLLNGRVQTVKSINENEADSTAFEFKKIYENIEGEFIVSVFFTDTSTDERVSAKCGNHLIKSFYEQLVPKECTLDDFQGMKNRMKHWSREHVLGKKPEEMFGLLKDFLPMKNLFVYRSEEVEKKDMFMGVTSGMGEGMYTGLIVNATLTVIGKDGEDISKIRIDVLSDNAEVLHSAASELFESIHSMTLV